MGRSQFTFYESFARALGRIKKKADRADAYDAICNYALYGTEPDLDKLPDSAAIAFDLIRPTLDASKRKAESGKRGGDGKQSESKPEANRKQTGSKPEANEEQGESKPEANRKREQSESEGEKENEIENECSPSLYLPHAENGSKPEAQIGTVVYPPVKGPTLDQVREYARIRRSQADPKAFFDYYAAAGWRDREGKPVLNWQQTFIAWELREQRGGKNGRSVGKQGLSCMDKDRDLTREEEAYRDKVLEMRRHMEEQRARKKAAAGGGEG